MRRRRLRRAQGLINRLWPWRRRRARILGRALGSLGTANTAGESTHKLEKAGCWRAVGALAWRTVGKREQLWDIVWAQNGRGWGLERGKRRGAWEMGRGLAATAAGSRGEMMMDKRKAILTRQRLLAAGTETETGNRALAHAEACRELRVRS